MHDQSRRNFLSSLGDAALLPLALPERTVPETILHNGNIITVNSRQPRAQAVAIVGGRFLAIGTNDEIRALGDARTRRVDLAGKTVVPGFIDAHSHPAVAGRLHLREVDCDLRSIKEIQAAVAKRASETPAGKWVLGFKYDDTKTSEGRPLTRDDLDVAAPDHPVRIAHRGGHTAYVNSLALKIAGVTEKTPDPPGGRFDRDSSGKLNGKASENATDVSDKFIPNTYTRDDYREGIKLITKMTTRTGVTSVHDAYGSPNDLRAYQDARRRRT